MSLEIRPGIVWGVDTVGAEEAQQWCQGLDPQARRFIRPAKNWEEVRDILREYNQDAFTDELRELGLISDRAGRKVTAVLLAQGMGPTAFRDWPEVFSRLDGLEKDVVALERHIVLLARYRDFRPKERVIARDGIISTPWLISTRASDGVELGERTFHQVISQLLNVLLLADRRGLGEQAGRAFLDGSPSRDHARLVAFPVQGLAAMLEDMADICTAALLHSLVRDEHCAPNEAEAMYKGFERELREYRGGAMPEREVLRRMLGPKGLGRWAPGLLLVEGPRILRRLIAAESELGSTPTTHASPKPEPLRSSNRWPGVQGFLIRFLVWLKLWRVAAANSAGSSRTTEEAQVVHARLAAALAVLEGLKVKAGRLGEPTQRIPQSRLDEWTARFAGELRCTLEDIAEGRDWTADGALDLAATIRDRATAHVRDAFPSAVEDWGLQSDRLVQFRQDLHDGTLFRFSACSRAGQHPTVACGVSSVRIDQPVRCGDRPAPVTQVTSWPGVGPILLGASEPVLISHLVW